MFYFKNCRTAEELKKEYKRLCMKWHPDRCHESNATELMQAINAEFAEAFDRLKNVHTSAEGKIYTSERETSETADHYRMLIEELLKLSGVIVEICGTWIWCTGETRAHKDKLKELGFYWSRQKVAWYYHEEAFIKKSKRSLTLDEIRDYYGSETFERKQRLLKA